MNDFVKGSSKSSGPRRRAREIALQVLFQMEFTSQLSVEDAMRLYLENFEAEDEVKEYAAVLVKGVWQYRKDLDAIIQTHSKNWKLDRMAFVDRNILRVASFELKYLTDQIPPRVAIDEAIEIGKRFGSQDSSSFINGILDNIIKATP